MYRERIVLVVMEPSEADQRENSIEDSGNEINESSICDGSIGALVGKMAGQLTSSTLL